MLPFEKFTSFVVFEARDRKATVFVTRYVFENITGEYIQL
jgi:hypothetical protein